ncbi:MAG: hypothetical protein ABIP03_06015 [Aquihabitans sp.]
MRTEQKRKVGTLHLVCNGCEVTGWSDVTVEVSIEDLGSGVAKVSAAIPPVRDLVPEGWQICDPYTYCPACWRSIEDESGEGR